MANASVRFENFELNLDSFELLSGGEPIGLEPQEMAVLECLIRHANQVVTKEALLDEVWGHQHVTDAAISTRIKGVRRGLGDDGRQQRLIKTVHGKGFRFVGELVTATLAPIDLEVDPEVERIVTNLPRERTPMFGRDGLGERCSVALQSHRLVSLLGIGGAGKTRLSIAVGHSLLDQYTDGVWFIDLIPCQDSAQIVAAIAHAIGVEHATGIGNLVRSLAHRRMLLVLDNCEHVVTEARSVVDDLLDGTADVHFLATSRVPLELADEARIPIGTLRTDSHDDDDAPAIKMFVATASRIGAALRPDQMAEVRALCVRLDGLPLALELAAAQLRHLSLEELAARLDQRFEILNSSTAGQRSSLESVLQETYAVLTPEARVLLSQLAVFPASFDFTAADSIMHKHLTNVSADFANLVDKSLIVRTDEDNRRWRMLESVRIFALQNTPDDEHLRHSAEHANWVLQVNTDPLTESFWRFKQAQWYSAHIEDTQAAERFFFDNGQYQAGAELLIRQALAMANGLGSHAANMLIRLEAYPQYLQDPDTISLLHSAAVYYARAALQPEAMLVHGKSAATAAEHSLNWEIKFLARSMVVWPRLASPHTRSRLQEMESLTLEPNDSTTATLNMFRAYLLAFEKRWPDIVALLQPSVDLLDSATGEPNYSSVNATNLWAVAHLRDEPAVVLSVLDRAQEALGFRDVDAHLTCALVNASAVNADQVHRTCRIIRARQQQAHLSFASEVLLPCAMLALRSGEKEMARQWLSATKPFPAAYLITVAAEIVAETLGVTIDSVEAYAGDRNQLVDVALEWVSSI